MKCHSSAIFTDDTRSRNPPDWRNGAAREGAASGLGGHLRHRPDAGLAGTLRPGAILHTSWVNKVSVARRTARSLAYLPAEAEAGSRRRGIPALFSLPPPGRPFSPNEPMRPARRLPSRGACAAVADALPVARTIAGVSATGEAKVRGHTVGNNLCDPETAGISKSSSLQQVGCTQRLGVTAGNP